MRAPRTIAWVLAAAFGAVASACHRQAAPPHMTVAEAAADSMRGIVERVGNEPRSGLIARAADGPACALRFAAVAEPALEGLEVVLWGARSSSAPPIAAGTSCVIDVTRFAVRAVDGIAAVDGMLRAEGTSFVLETSAGARAALRDVPATLRMQVGARIFWAGPLDRAPAAYGVILAPRP